MESSKEKDYEDFGLISFIKPNYNKDSFQSLFERGTHNGYVAIPPKYRDIIEYSLLLQPNWFDNNASCKYLDDLIQIHGGITCDFTIITQDDLKWLRDAITVCPINDRTIATTNCGGYRIIGFDTCHHNDNKNDWNIQTVSNETLRLKNQLIKIIEEKL